jgi:TonB family protein
MPQEWKRFEGRTIDGKFRLQKYLGESTTSAVFLSDDVQGHPTVVKLVKAEPNASDSQLLRWRAAQKLSHPHLIRLFDCGSCVLFGVQLLYVVMEYADESLSTILPERALTPAEVREMLGPTLEALGYIHSQSLIHGHVKPSNMLAVNEQLKISSDGVFATGSKTQSLMQASPYLPPEHGNANLSPAADIWSLGVTLVEVLTQKVPSQSDDGQKRNLPSALPIPFRAIAEKCLRADPQQRPTVSEIKRDLDSPPVPVSTSMSLAKTPSRTLRPFLIAGALLVLIIAGLYFLLRRPGNALPRSQNTITSPAALDTTAETKASPPPVGATANAEKVILRVLPDVSRNSLRTIHGTIKVRLRVTSDTAGNVEKTRLEAGGPSRYFADRAVEAAKQWKFQPTGPSGRSLDWNLEFQFRRSGVTARETALK